MSRLPRRKPLLSDPGPPLSPLPPAAQSPEGVWRWAVPLLLITYLVLAGLHAAWVPTGQTGYQNAPDEAAHVSYARTVASGHLPTQASAALDPTARSYEWHQPPLYYAWAAFFLPLGEQRMRIASILLGFVGILLIYQTARLLFPDDPILVTVATGIPALLPTHVAIISTINNDVLLEVCFSATLLLLIQSFLRGFTLWRAGWLGVLLGLALLTKATSLVLLPVVFLGLFLMWRAGERIGNLFRCAAWTFAIMLCFSGWWFVRNQHLYGELLPLRAFDQAFAGTALARDLIPAFGGAGGYFRIVVEWTFQSFWAVFGSMRSATKEHGVPLFLPDTIYALPLGIVIVALGGMMRLHFRRRQEFTDVQLRALWLLMTTLALVALSFALFLTKYFQTQGRYLFPAMLPISLLLALGWQAVFPSKYKSMAGGALLGILLLLALLFMTSVQAAWSVSTLGR